MSTVTLSALFMLQIICAIIIVWGIMNEQKLIDFEHEIWLAFKAAVKKRRGAKRGGKSKSAPKKDTAVISGGSRMYSGSRAA